MEDWSGRGADGAVDAHLVPGRGEVRGYLLVDGVHVLGLVGLAALVGVGHGRCCGGGGGVTVGEEEEEGDMVRLNVGLQIVGGRWPRVWRVPSSAGVEAYLG